MTRRDFVPDAGGTRADTRRMRVAGLSLLIVSVLALVGCRSPRAIDPVVRSLAPQDVVAAQDPGLQRPAPVRLTTSATWQRYDGSLDGTPVEREALRRCLCLQRARRKANLFTGAVVVGMAGYGAAVFGAGSSSFHTVDDGWFGEFTGSGGADKLGHALSAHIQTAIYSAVFRHWGLPRKEAALRGAVAAFSAQLALEVADGFSADHGFSINDVIANTAGCVFGYFHETSPGFARLFDFRWEYWPSEQVRSGEDSEITTDYEGSNYVLATNLGAIWSRRANALDFVDFQVGYGVRYYNDRSRRSERRPFVGFGINLANVCQRLGLRTLGRFFEYYQPPGIHLRWDTNLND